MPKATSTPKTIPKTISRTILLCARRHRPWRIGMPMCRSSARRPGQTNEGVLRGRVIHRGLGKFSTRRPTGVLLGLCRPIGGGRAAPPFEMPYSLDLPQADRDIWRLYDDLLISSHKTCTSVISTAKKRGFAAMREQIVRTGGEAYLRTLMSLDEQTRQWIGKILAGAA